MNSGNTLERTAFVTNRALEFFTEAELRTQVGYGKTLWPIVIVKELIDNALDASENAGVAPDITVKLEADALTVSDNGPGLPAKIIERSLDYQVRISDKKYYASPTRGQLGNALKCIWAIPFVVSESKEAKLEVISCGLQNRITISLDRIRQEPTIKRSTKRFVQNGSLIRIGWPGLASLETSIEIRDLYKSSIGDAIEAVLLDFAAFNPHASFLLTTPKSKQIRFPAREKSWTHWLASQPTSAHWYTPERLWDLVAAYLAEEQRGAKPKTIREFVSEFDGLRRPQYQAAVTNDAGLTGRLTLLVKKGQPDMPGIAKLLKAMQEHSKPVKPQRLGLLGKNHCFAMLKSRGIAPQSFRYKKLEGNENNLPFVVEYAFGVKTKEESGDSEPDRRQLLLGMNHSPVFKVPSGHLGDLLSNCKVQRHDPVVLLIHQASPIFQFTDHGKGAVADE